jgi:hypothetical protein
MKYFLTSHHFLFSLPSRASQQKALNRQVFLKPVLLKGTLHRISAWNLLVIMARLIISHFMILVRFVPLYLMMDRSV